MAHKTLQRNTTIMVFKFGAKPLEEFPEAFWQTAKQVQFIWNDLVGMRNKLTENFDRLGISGKENVKERIQYWKEFDKIWREYLKSDAVKTKLGNDEREFLQTKFETADKRAKQEKTGLRKQFSLERIYFRHRYSGGGKPLVDFQKQNSKGFSFLFPVSKHYFYNSKIDRKKRIGAGVFGCIKDREQVFSFPFSAVIHREIPENAIIKSVSWVGKRLKSRGYTKSKSDWIWSIDVAVEIPKEETKTVSIGRVAALDVGWRKSGDYLRIGAILDSDGNKLELRVPISHESKSARDGKLAVSLDEIISLDEQKGNLVEETKNKLKELGVKNLTKVREGGLFRIISQTEDEKVLEVLNNFKSLFLPLASKRVRSFDRLNKYRDWLYQNIASWLAENYDSLIWEGQLNLKKMAEDRKDLNKVETDYELEKIRRKSAKYRNFASLYGFRDYLKKAFTKRGKSIIDGITAYSSRTCSECGEKVDKFHNIEFICPNGHNFDRDFNAAKNLLNQIEGKFKQGEKLIIPNSANRDLSKVVVGLE